jgi:hypothetical protein
VTPDDPPRAPDAAPKDATPSPGSAPERRAGDDRRTGIERRARSDPVARERRSGVDRRSIPDRRAGRRGGEYELDADTLEFISAVNAFKERTGRAFPTWSDLLGILRELGWEKRKA